jgi:methionyl-tRNA formyltransferase
MKICKKKILDFSIDDLKTLFKQIKEEDNISSYLYEFEIIRKYISSRSLYLKKDLKKNFGSMYRDYLNLFYLIFYEITKKNIYRKNDLLDISILNTIYTLKKYINKRSGLFKKISCDLRNLELSLISSNSVNLNLNSLDQEFVYRHNTLKRESTKSIPVVILSPNPFSLYTGCIIRLCNYFNISIEAIIIRRFTLKRFIEECKRDGFIIILKKIFHKLIIKGDDNFSYSQVSLNYVFKKLSIADKNIKSVTKGSDIKMIYVNDFKKIDNNITPLKSKIALFTGGGIISETFINKFTKGIINLHVGNLPDYKGMDTVEAAILGGQFNSIALTSHLMAKNVDSGPILSKCIFSSNGYSEIGTIFNEVSALFPFMLIDSYLGVISGRYKKKIQTKEGKLHFTLNKELKYLVNKVLYKRSVNYNRPVLIKKLVGEILKNFS